MQWFTEETGWILPEDDFTGDRLTPEQLTALGAGLAHAASRTMIGYADSDYAAVCAMLLCGGIAAAGGETLFAQDCALPELAAGASAGDCGIIVHCGESGIRMLSRGMLPLTAAQEDAIRSGAVHPQWMEQSDCGSIAGGKSLCTAYPARVQTHLPQQFTVRPQIETASPRLRTLLTPIFQGGSGPRVTLRISADGRRASLYTEKTSWIFYEKLLLMCAQQYLLQGKDVALPCWVPHIAERMAEEQGRSILRYASHPDGKDTEARRLAIERGFSLDGAILCADILRMHAQAQPDLGAWAASLPPCYTVRRVLHADSAADALVRCSADMHASREPDGLRIRTAEGEALLHPARNSRAVSMFVEAASMEAASELAGWIIGKA